MVRISKELYESLIKLYEVAWFEIATVELNDPDGYSGLSYSDEEKIEVACRKIEHTLLMEHMERG